MKIKQEIRSMLWFSTVYKLCHAFNAFTNRTAIFFFALVATTSHGGGCRQRGEQKNPALRMNVKKSPYGRREKRAEMAVHTTGLSSCFGVVDMQD